MRETERISDEIRRGYHGDPWHGFSTRAILHDVTASQAVARPVPGAHTILEIVLHMTSWMREAHRRLLGTPPALPLEGDWQAAADDSDEAAWMEARAALADAHTELLATLDAFPEERLDRAVGDRVAALGTGVSHYVLLHGLSQHNAYHSGQIALLKRALE